MRSVYCEFMICYVRFALPPHQVLNNFEGLDLGIMDKIYDFGLASYIDGRVRKKKERQEEGKKRIRRLCG